MSTWDIAANTCTASHRCSHFLDWVKQQRAQNSPIVAVWIVHPMGIPWRGDLSRPNEVAMVNATASSWLVWLYTVWEFLSLETTHWASAWPNGDQADRADFCQRRTTSRREPRHLELSRQAGHTKSPLWPTSAEEYLGGIGLFPFHEFG